MSRNIGGSIGTSVLTTMLVRREQVQQSYLVQHLSVFDAWRMSNAPALMPGAGKHFDYMSSMVNGQKRGFAMIYSSVQTQAMMISLNNIYRMLGYLMILGVVLCFLLPRTRGKAPAGAH
jgi:DHA2 family multidrug resistance protein